jgi:hypothetical protein
VAGAAVATVAGSGLAGNVAAAEYDTITVSSGERRTINVGSNETLENVIIDISAADADARILAEGDGWTVRNVGFRGSSDVSNEGGYPNVFLASGNGVIENLYLGDGVAADGVRKGGIGVPKSHSGHIEIRNAYIARWTGNSIYAATPAESDGGGGSISVHNSYFRDNTISHIRIANDDSYLEDCVITNTNNVPQHPWGTSFSRGLWSLYGDTSQVVEIRNCDIDITNENSNGGGDAVVSVTSEPMSQFRLVDSDIKGNMTEMANITTENCGESPTTKVPSGVPTSAEAAASGTSGSSSDSTDGTTDDSTNDSTTTDLPNTLTLRGTGEPTNYVFSVDGDLQGNPDEGKLESWDNISGGSADGWVTDSSQIDSFEFSGSVTDFRFEQGKADVFLNGTKVSPDNLGQGSANVLTIRGTGEPTNYVFSVDGSLDPNPNEGGLESWDNISGSSADGWVTDTNHVDSFHFTGSVTDFRFEKGQADVYLNGTKVSVDSFGQTSDVLTLRGAGEPTNYVFSVDGDVEANPEKGSLESWDNISGSSVNGWITDSSHVDSFQITGSVTDFRFDTGQADVYLNGEQVDPSNLT